MPPSSRKLERRRSVFSTYARGWLAGRHDLRATTRASYRTAIERHLVPTFGDVPLTEISASLIRSWFQSYGDRAPTARAHAYQVLALVMAEAEQDELILRNPCRIKAGGRTTVAREPEVLTLAELLALADAMPPQHRALTLLCGLCGLRFGEAVALRRRDVDLEVGVVSVAEDRGPCRRGKDHECPEDRWRPGVRWPCRRWSWPRCANTWRQHQFAAATHSCSPAATVSCSPPRRCTDVRSVSSGAETGRTQSVPTASTLRARSSASRSCTGTTFGRTAATLGAQSGATVREMQHRLGHTTPTMALRYQAATAERDRAIADRLQAQIDALRGVGTVTPLHGENAR